MCSRFRKTIANRRVIQCTIALVLFAYIGNGFSCTQKTTGNKPMNDDQRKALEVISVSDEDYLNPANDYVLSLQNQLVKVLSKGMMMATPGQPQKPVPGFYALSAAKVVDIQNVDKVAALLASEESGLGRWQVDPKQNLQLALYDHELNKLLVKRYSTMPEGKRQVIPKPSGSGNTPSQREQNMTFTSVTPIYLNNQFKEDLHGGQFSLAVLVYNKPSNIVSFEVKDTAPAKELNTNIVQPVHVNNVSVADLSIIDVSLDRYSKSSRIVTFSLNSRVLSAVTCEKSKPVLASLTLIKLDSASSVVVDMLLPVPADYDNKSALSWEMDLSEIISKNSLSGLYQAYLLFGKQLSSAFEIEID